MSAPTVAIMEPVTDADIGNNAQLVQLVQKKTIIDSVIREVPMQHSVRTISSSDAKANLSDVLSSLSTHGPIEITIDGKAVALLTLPPVQTVDRSRMSALAIAYSNGLISWPQIAEETGASYGDLLVALGLNNLPIPKVTPKNRPEQIAFFHHILDLASAESTGNGKP